MPELTRKVTGIDTTTGIVHCRPRTLSAISISDLIDSRMHEVQEKVDATMTTVDPFIVGDTECVALREYYGPEVEAAAWTHVPDPLPEEGHADMPDNTAMIVTVDWYKEYLMQVEVMNLLHNVAQGIFESQHKILNIQLKVEL
jgi:hypothetical protein